LCLSYREGGLHGYEALEETNSETVCQANGEGAGETASGLEEERGEESAQRKEAGA
jgi:hypothetical protein